MGPIFFSGPSFAKAQYSWFGGGGGSLLPIRLFSIMLTCHGQCIIIMLYGRASSNLWLSLPLSLGSATAKEASWGASSAPWGGNSTPRGRDWGPGGADQTTQGQDSKAQGKDTRYQQLNTDGYSCWIIVILLLCMTTVLCWNYSLDFLLIPARVHQVHGVDVACVSLFPRSKRGLLGRHILDRLGRTLELCTDFFKVEKLIRVWGRV